MRKIGLFLGMFLAVSTLCIGNVQAKDSEIEDVRAHEIELQELSSGEQEAGCISTRQDAGTDAKSGTCGVSANWELHGSAEEGYVLVISGTGEMFDYTPQNAGDNWVSGAPWGNYDITEVVFGEGITKVGSHNFIGCVTIQNVQFSSTVKTIGSSAFEHCIGITNLTIPENVKDIGSWSFAYCTGLSTVTIGGDNQDIAGLVDTYAFYHCTGLTDLVVNGSIARICGNAFRGCTKLGNITLMPGIRMIDSYVFYECNALICINIPKSVRQIGDNAFGMAYNASSRTYRAIPGFVVCGTLNSAAESYAISRTIIFIELERTQGFIVRLYETILGRKAEQEETDYWIEAFKTGQETAATLVEKFMLSLEMNEQNLSDKEFVRRCYLALLDREPEEAGFDYWMMFLEGGLSRRYIVVQFFESPEFSEVCERYGIRKGEIKLTDVEDLNPYMTMFVYRCYKCTLSRVPDESGKSYWIKALVDGKVKPVELAMAIMFSDEFIEYDFSDKQFIQILYQMFMDREADTNGLMYWLDMMENGMQRVEVIVAFANSIEFKVILAYYGMY